MLSPLLLRPQSEPPHFESELPADPKFRNELKHIDDTVRIVASRLRVQIYGRDHSSVTDKAPPYEVGLFDLRGEKAELLSEVVIDGVLGQLKIAGFNGRFDRKNVCLTVQLMPEKSVESALKHLLDNR